MGAALLSTVVSMPWWLGDWYLAGLELARAEWGKVQSSKFKVQSSEPTHLELAALVRQLFRAPDRAWKTAQNAAVVCRAFPPARRREGLTFSHHESLASLPAREQTRWLDRAEAGQWSTADLREAVRAGQRPRGALQPAGRLYMLSAGVAEMLRWLKAQDLAGDPARRQAIKEELAPLVEFANGL
jgi:hypothetical protein